MSPTPAAAHALPGREFHSGRPHPATILSGLLLLLHCLLTPVVRAAPGDEHWWDGFASPGVSGTVRALHAEGASLYVGGHFTVAGRTAASKIARWDGSEFHPMGDGLDGNVLAITTFNGGIIAAGTFQNSGNRPVSRIARWDGAAWQPLGAGLSGGSFVEIRALLVHEGALFAAGRFTMAGGQPAQNIARWDGAAWAPLGAGLDGIVNQLVEHDGLLVAGGSFQNAGGAPASRIAGWNGAGWVPFGSGAPAHAMISYQGDLYTAIGDYFSSGVWRWDGAAWVPHGSFGPVTCFEPYGGQLVAGGAPFGYYPVDTCCLGGHLAGWDGAAWSQLDPGPISPYDGFNGFVYDMAVFQGELVVGGAFNRATGPILAGFLARWDGTAIRPLHATPGPGGTDMAVYAAASLGPEQALGGNFQLVGGEETRYVTKLSGVGWQEMGLGDQSGPNRYDGGPTVSALATWNGWLIAGGGFYIPGNPPALGVARGGGGAWMPLGAGINGSVEALAVFNDEIIAGGSLAGSGPTPLDAVARFDGLNWQPLGTPTGGGCGVYTRGEVTALAVYRGELIVGGCFTQIGGIAASNIARWNGTTWSPLGAGVSGPVTALLSLGPRLVVGGHFTQAGGAPAANVAVWNGGLLTWSPLGAGISSSSSYHQFVNALALYNGDVIAAGDFETAGGLPARNIARWNGVDWSPMGSGVDGVVEALAAGTSLVVGGAFQAAGSRVAANVALWNDDFVVPVLAASLAAARDGARVVLEWEAADLTHAGFHVYREEPGRERIRLTDSPLAGGPRFRWIDESPPDGAADYWLLEITRSGGESWHGPASLLPPAPALGLTRISANPSRGPVTFGYAVPAGGDVSLRLYDVHGRLVRTLLSGAVAAGRSEVSWDGRDGRGSPAAAGTYFLRLETPFGNLSEKIQRLP